MQTETATLAVEDEVVYPGDHPVDDPILVEVPRRPQREIDIEAFNLHLAGYSVRQIARLHDVHPNTAFNRIKRGRAIDARHPLQAEGLSMHAEAAKLRQLERAVLPAAIAGDLASVKLVLRIIDKLWRLAKFARENPRVAEEDVGSAMEDGRCDASVPGATPQSSDDTQTTGALPQAPVDAASSAERNILAAQTQILRQRPTASPDSAGFDDLLANYRRHPVPLTAEQPISRRERKRRKWARREQRANAARTVHQHRANSSASARCDNRPENREIFAAGASGSRASHSP